METPQRTSPSTAKQTTMTQVAPIPLSLFETETLEQPSTPLRQRLRSVEWSYSRRNTFERCLQKYYLAYYASVQRFAPNEPDKGLIRQLKLRQNRYERTGEIVHTAIANYFRAGQKGKVQNTRALVEQARRLLAEDLGL